MAVDPRILSIIADPTSGKLGQIGQTIAANKQQEMENQAAQQAALEQSKLADINIRLKNAELKDQAMVVANNYASNALNWKRENPDASKEEFAAYQAAEWNALSEDEKAIIPGKLQDEEELKRGKVRSLGYLATKYPDKYITEDEGTRRNALLDGKIVPAIERAGHLYNPETNERMPTATLAPTRAETGEPGAFGGTTQEDKIKAERTATQSALNKHVKGIDYLADIVASDDFIGGNTAQVASALNSAAAQLRQVTGTDSILDEEGNVDTSQIDPTSKELSRLRRGAITSDSYDAALIEMAYIKAKQVDPSSKITDKDFAFARKMLQSGADKTSLLNVLKNERRRAIEGYNTEENVISSRYENYDKTLWNEKDYKESLVEPSPKNEADMGEDEMADKLLKDAGLL